MLRLLLTVTHAVMLSDRYANEEVAMLPLLFACDLFRCLSVLGVRVSRSGARSCAGGVGAVPEQAAVTGGDAHLSLGSFWARRVSSGE